MRSLIFFLATAASSLAQANASDNSYLLRLELTNSQGDTCVLLQKTGFFHLELEHEEQARILEGTLNPEQLLELERTISDSALASLSQRQIQEPLMSTSKDTLQLNIFRQDHWQDLLFESGESQEPYKTALGSLTRWLGDLHKLPHKQFTEEERRNNCLPAKPIVLKKRNFNSPPKPVASAASSPKPVISSASSRPAAVMTVSPLMRIASLRITGGGAHQSCALIADDGRYRFERRTQSTGSKQVQTAVFAGNITGEELNNLRQILANPALEKVGHREPPGNAAVPLLGDMVDLSVRRSNGIQHIVLSSGFNRRQMGFFYGGDADITVAQPLLKFLSEHIENNNSGALDPALRNECTEP